MHNMANFCLILAYDGTRYNGWQRQGNTSDKLSRSKNAQPFFLSGNPNVF